MTRCGLRLRSVFVAALLGAALGASASFAAEPAPAAPAKPKRAARVLPGTDVELKTKDGWTLAARYNPPKEGLLTFVLLHETGGRKENWYFLARAMAKRGIGYLALDFRGHAGSQSPPPGVASHWRKFPAPTKALNEWNGLTLDVEAAVDYLQTQGVLPSLIGMGGADVGSSIALKYAAVHSQVPMLFMLSPGMSYREILTVNAIRAYTKRPILLVVGADDNRSNRETAILYHFAKQAAGADKTTLITAEREHGTRILVVNKGTIGQILDWIENPEPTQEPEVSTETPNGNEPLPLPSEDDLTSGQDSGASAE